MFDSQKQIIIKADVSDQVQKSMLSQSDKLENLYLITFYSQKFSELKLNYKIYNKKLLKIVKAFK